MKPVGINIKTLSIHVTAWSVLRNCDSRCHVHPFLQTASVSSALSVAKATVKQNRGCSSLPSPSAASYRTSSGGKVTVDATACVASINEICCLCYISFYARVMWAAVTPIHLKRIYGHKITELCALICIFYLS